ncbi:hypothetical protein J2W30_004588 [Variovorax boronicumulans]|uniref:hypothetical protein n=1 Tax=Variovorax boronicumulans TaxID=436515 RepID=UPI002782E311|nr:hypothetical protein [Variovorax boronicumulans]MDP9995644.1 hypothetical protein [Variovorax boronicumulans]MDQ0006891.1 hypothetical protein [Variovorax boronicumulans]MDQ0036813.1 hypothetical protein [Variovorax boronicumulans]MDQ0044510.1 hypothetical protein [Variovorax boronicumulans]
MLDKWSESDRLKAEEEIFEKLVLVDPGFLTGAPVQNWHPLAFLNIRTSSPHTTRWSVGVSAMTLTSMP